MAALVLFKIERDVRIKWVGGHSASHRCHDGGHLITLSTNRPDEVVNRNLWHELGHAWQAERFPDGEAFDAAYLSSGGYSRNADAYRGSIYEIEARKIADAYGRFRLASGGTFPPLSPRARAILGLTGSP